MKKLNELMAALTAIAIIVTTACTTMNGGFDPVPAIQVASMMGTQYALRDHPEWRPKFELAVQELQVLETSEKIDFVSLMAIVNRLPVDQLSSDDAQLAIAAGTMLLAGYGRSVEIGQIDNLKPVTTALRTGIESGLAQPSPASAGARGRARNIEPSKYYSPR